MSDETKADCHAAFAEEIEHAITEEVEAAERYHGMASEVEAAHPGSPWGHVLQDMAREEEHHKRLLEEMREGMSGH